MATATIQNATETSGSATLIAARNRTRKWIMVQADADNGVSIAIGFSKDVAFAADDADAGIVLVAGASIIIDQMGSLNANQISIYGVHAGSNGEDPLVRVIEL